MKFNLPARKPFNFTSVVNSHGWRQLAPFSYDGNANTLSYVLRLSNGRVIELKLRDATDGVTVETQKLNKSERKEVMDKVTWMFGLDMDFALFYIASRGEPKLARVKKRALGRVLRSPTLFEDVIKTILTTNTLWTATKNMTLKLVNEFGEHLSSAGRVAPNAGRVAPNDTCTARKCRCSEGRTEVPRPRPSPHLKQLPPPLLNSSGKKYAWGIVHPQFTILLFVLLPENSILNLSKQVIYPRLNYARSC